MTYGECIYSLEKRVKQLTEQNQDLQKALHDVSNVAEKRLRSLEDRITSVEYKRLIKDS